MTQTQTRGCVYTAHGAGYHELIWYDTHHTTVDAYIDLLAQLYATTPPQPRLIRWLVRDGGASGLPSVSYFLARVRDLEHRYPDRPNTRSAIIYGSGMKLFLLNALITLTNIRGRDTTRFFSADQEDAAMTWLMQD